MRRLNAITFKQLRALSQVCETGTISAAAEMLSLTPPAVHSQLKALEEIVGCQILKRGAEGFEPTPEGEALLGAWRISHSVLEKAIRQIETLSKGLAGTVVLGVVSTAKYFAPRLVVLLREAFPDIDVVLRIGNRAQIIRYLQNEEADLVIMGRPPREPLVTAQSIGEHPHLLVAPPGHPLTQLDTVRPADILSEHIVLREPGSGTRILTMRYFDEISPGHEYRHTEMESNETIKQAVIAGLGIAILSAHTMHEELRSGRLVAVPARGLPIMRHWFVVHRAEAEPSHATRTVKDWITANPDRYLPSMDLVSQPAR
ncbi:LysR family regulator CbbR [Jhaorihella thermophila]|uniref:HTH-type transcriptional regulator CbbR n=1 Tax=Jhaorihella thermophila TaxID=488547 RepID=A0A1H5XKU1_9RHOB|nr:LysR family transcriptional regulator [Jhaorihella thermophila]SEG12384.1 DNA-binding transcriptional regulator, LysR family [Jhaorihella thermophila]